MTLKSAVRAGAASLVVVTAVSSAALTEGRIHLIRCLLLDSQERGNSHERLARRKHGDSQERGESRGRLAARRHGGQSHNSYCKINTDLPELLLRLAGARQ